MSYLQALIRTRQGMSDARPRSLSRFERPEAAWEIEIDPPEVEIPRGTIPHGSAPASPAAPTSIPPSAISPAPWGHATLPPGLPAIAPDPPPVAALQVPGQERATAHSDEPTPVQPPSTLRLPAADTVAPPPAVPAQLMAVAADSPPTPPRERLTRLERELRVEAHPHPLPLPRSAATAGAPSLPQAAPLAPTPPQQTQPASPQHSAPAAANPASTAPAPILVEIGQIDIRLEAPLRAAASVEPAARRVSAPALSLEDYLRGRS